MFIDNSAGPREFGPNDDASLELPAEGAYRVQEALRVMGLGPTPPARILPSQRPSPSMATPHSRDHLGHAVNIPE